MTGVQTCALPIWAFAILVILAAGLAARAREWRKSLPLLAIGVAAIAPSILCEWQWRREHADFHQLAARLARAGVGGCVGVKSRPEIAEFAAGIRSLDFEPTRVVWRGFSMRRNEIYDCASGATRIGQ